MKILFLIILLMPSTSYACLENEIFIKEQLIEPYLKSDGTHVSGHIRTSHCRLIENYTFKDQSNKEFKGIKTKFKSWTKKEKLLIDDLIKKMPLWLSKYKISEILRANYQLGNIKNPAAIHPVTRELIIFDQFFKELNQDKILIHELSHVAVLNINEEKYPLLIDFFQSNGWTYQIGKPPIPPKKVIIEDSVDSPSEDFANSVEVFYTDPEKLKQFNKKSYFILEEIIQPKSENKK